jgi:hypothetical protein
VASLPLLDNGVSRAVLTDGPSLPDVLNEIRSPYVPLNPTSLAKGDDTGDVTNGAKSSRDAKVG